MSTPVLPEETRLLSAPLRAKVRDRVYNQIENLECDERCALDNIETSRRRLESYEAHLAEVRAALTTLRPLHDALKLSLQEPGEAAS